MEYRIGSPNALLHEEECAWQEDRDEKCSGNGLYKGLVRADQGRMEAGRLPETDRVVKAPADLAEIPLMLFPLAGN